MPFPKSWSPVSAAVLLIMIHVEAVVSDEGSSYSTMSLSSFLVWTVMFPSEKKSDNKKESIVEHNHTLYTVRVCVETVQKYQASFSSQVLERVRFSAKFS
jgi:hypothetical protein